MRVYQHIIDTMAIKTTMNSIPHHWVVRDVSERDYGIDMMIEIFRKAGTNEHKHDYYDATGAVCYLQLKGTNSELEINVKDGTIHYQIDKDALLYVEKFPTPFILMRVSVVEGKEKVYFLWLQRYIMDVMDEEIPNWRTKQIKNKEGELVFQESYVIRIPASNLLETKKAKKIEWIASRIKYLEEHAEFHEKFESIRHLLPDLSNRGLTAKEFSDIRKLLKRLMNFDTLYYYNNVMIGTDTIAELIDYVQASESGIPYPLEHDEEYPNQFNLELLHNEGAWRISIENFEAENNEETVY